MKRLNYYYSCIFLAFISFKIAEVEALVVELQYIYPCSLQLGSFYSLWSKLPDTQVYDFFSHEHYSWIGFDSFSHTT